MIVAPLSTQLPPEARSLGPDLVGSSRECGGATEQDVAGTEPAPALGDSEASVASARLAIVKRPAVTWSAQPRPSQPLLAWARLARDTSRARVGRASCARAGFGGRAQLAEVKVTAARRAPAQHSLGDRARDQPRGSSKQQILFARASTTATLCARAHASAGSAMAAAAMRASLQRRPSCCASIARPALQQASPANERSRTHTQAYELAGDASARTYVSVCVRVCVCASCPKLVRVCVRV